MDSRDDDKRAAISEEAAEWFIRLRDDDLGIADQYQYLLWLKESPAHVAEMLRICRLYVVLQTADLHAIDAPGASVSNVIDLAAREQASNSSPPVRARRWRAAAVIATVAASGLLALAATLMRLDQTLVTDAGEWRIVTLMDGSRAKLGPLTHVRIDMGDAQRLVRLDRGEAVFEVAEDPARPFVVKTELAVVRAVGTAFEVAHRDGRVVVTVAEGVVEVGPGSRRPAIGASGQESVRVPVPVKAGGQVSVARAWPVRVRQVDAEREMAWADGLLHFDTESVADAVDEFNRRNLVQIVVEDEALRQRPVRASYDARDPEAFARDLTTVAPATIVRDEPGVLRIVRSTSLNISADGSAREKQ